MSVIFAGKGTDTEREGFTKLLTVLSIPVDLDTRIIFSGSGTDTEREEYTVITRDLATVSTSIFLSCKGSDSERLDYTKFFEPNPVRIKGGTGAIENYTLWYSGLGDISGDLAEYTNRDGENPNGGTGIL